MHEDSRARNLTEKQFVDDFLECDVLVFLTHPGQSRVNRPHNHQEATWQSSSMEHRDFIEGNTTP